MSLQISLGRHVGKTAAAVIGRNLRDIRRRGARPRWPVHHVSKRRVLVSGLFRMRKWKVMDGRGYTSTVRQMDTYQSDGLQIVGSEELVLFPTLSWPKKILDSGDEEFYFYLHTLQGMSPVKGTTTYHGEPRWVFNGHVYQPSPVELMEHLVAVDLEGVNEARLDEAVVLS
jgi:hypothetical protein